VGFFTVTMVGMALAAGLDLHLLGGRLANIDLDKSGILRDFCISSGSPAIVDTFRVQVASFCPGV
jgi:hypothetical protein